MKTIVVSAALLLCVAAGAAGPDAFPVTFEEWAAERVGPVVFPEGSSHSWAELTNLAQDLGAHAVKTWVGADNPGDALAKVRSEPYLELVRRFKVVHFNISPGYIVRGYGNGKTDPAMLDAVRDEWRKITAFLCANEGGADKTFLLSVGGELNVYVGTAKAYPDFPVAEYVNACHAGMKQGLAEAGGKGARVYSVAELQGDIEYDAFAAKWVSQFDTDLISLSYYTFYRPLDDALGVLKKYAKPLGPFGEHRLMMGEYGPSMEVCNWNHAELARWHNDILHAAYAQQIQYAFFYEIADHEFVINTGSHDGLVTWAPDATQRLAWQYYHRLYHEKVAGAPDFDLYEKRHDEKTAETGAKLVVSEIRPTAESPKAGALLSFVANIRNDGTAASTDTGVNFFVVDRMIAWVWLPPLEAGKSVEVRCDQGDARFAWTTRHGMHRIAVVADPRGKNGAAVEQNGQILVK